MTKETAQTETAKNVTVDLKIRALPDRVFRALTDASEIRRWWSSAATVDAKNGGVYRVVFEFDDPAKNMTQHTRITAFEAGRSFSIAWKNPMPGPETHATFTADPDGKGTRLRLVHEGFAKGGDWEAYREKIQGGWDWYLGNLKTVLEEGKDQRVGTGQKLNP